MSQTNNQMPKFDFSKSTVKTTAELEALVPVRKESKFFSPGRHEVVIDTVEYTGAANDPTWSKVTLTLVGAGEKSIKEFIMVPHSSLLYVTADGKNSGYPFRRLQNLIGALGLELTPENATDVLASLFTNPDALKGLRLVIETGYRNAHLKFSREGEATVVNIVKKDGTILTDGKSPLVFSDRDSAMNYGEQNNIEIDGFVSITGYDVSATPNKNLSRKKGTGTW